MELISILDTNFVDLGLEILQKDGLLLILIHYPCQAGNRDFYLLKSEADFLKILKERQHSDVVTIFRTIEIHFKGHLSINDISEIISKIKMPLVGDWLVVYPDEKKWEFIENSNDLKEALNDAVGKMLYILTEPNWHSKEAALWAYKPDLDGIVRPGIY